MPYNTRGHHGCQPLSRWSELQVSFGMEEYILSEALKIFDQFKDKQAPFKIETEHKGSKLCHFKANAASPMLFHWTNPEGQQRRYRFPPTATTPSPAPRSTGPGSPPVPPATTANRAGSKRKAPEPPSIPVLPPVSLHLLIAMAAGKGGVGKSLLARELWTLYALKHPEQRFLIFDFDPQCNAAGIAIDFQEDVGGGLFDVFSCSLQATKKERLKLLANATHDTRVPNLKVSYANKEQMGVLEAMITSNPAPFTCNFAKVMKLVKEQYDVVIADTTGYLKNKALQVILQEADAIISPVNSKDVLEVKELLNTYQLAKMTKMAVARPSPKIGFVLNKVPGQTAERTIDGDATKIIADIKTELAPEDDTDEDASTEIVYLGKLRQSMELPASTNPKTPPLVLSSAQATAILRDEFAGIVDKVAAFLS